MNLILLCSLLLISIGFGFYFYTKQSIEGFAAKPRCPDMLIQKGSKIYLYNSKLTKVPGVNPIEFDNLEDYTQFLEWQRSQGIRCPVLYLQSSYDAQGNAVYKVRPDILEPQAGLPPAVHDEHLPLPNPTLLVDSTRNDPPYNKGSYPSHDQTSYYVGTTTPLDMMNVAQENAAISPDPMDPNWGGAAYTQRLVDAGYYKDNEVSIRVP